MSLVYLFFDVGNTIIKDHFPNPLQYFCTSKGTYPFTNSSKMNLAIQIIWCRKRSHGIPKLKVYTPKKEKRKKKIIWNKQ